MKIERPYRLVCPLLNAYAATLTYTTEQAARDAVTERVPVGRKYRIERRLGSRHSRKVEVIAEGVRE